MRVPLKGGVSVRTVMEDGGSWQRGWMDMRPTFPPTLREQGNSLEVSLQGWLGPGSPSPTSLMRGPSQSGAQGQWATEAAGISPTEPQLLRTRVGQDGPHRTNAVSTECQPSRMVPSPASHCHQYPEKATLAPSGRGHSLDLPQFRVVVADERLSSVFPLTVWKH